MDRRHILTGLAGGTALATIGLRASGPQSKGVSMAKASTYEPEKSAIPNLDEWQLDKAAWKERLTAEQYRVLRREGTERAWTSPLNDEKRAGTYLCVGCGLPLFSHLAKYDSGTGWPSFYEPIDDVLGTKTDTKLFVPRVEYHCARCGGHHGHVFKDGPAPTGLRYCNNGVALKFVPSEESEPTGNADET